MWSCVLPKECRNAAPVGDSLLQMMVDMTAEHPVNEILAIRRYHVIYTIPDTQWRGSSKCRKQAVCVKD